MIAMRGMLLWLCLMNTCEGQQFGEEPYHILQLPNNAGIFYEDMKQVKMMANTWKITVGIDVLSLVRAQEVANEQLSNLSEECHLPRAQGIICARDLQLKSLKRIQDEATFLQEHLREVIKPNDALSRKKREPIFGFISRILGPIIGVTDYTQHDQLVEQVKKLYEDKNQIAAVLSNSTHILQSEIDGQQKYLNQTTENIKILRAEAQLVRDRLGNAIDRVGALEMRMQMIHLGNEAVEAAQHYLDTLKKIVGIVEDINHGVINPNLLTREQLSTAGKDIRIHAPELDLPIDPENPDLSLLSKIADVHLLHSEGKLIAVISMPLFSRVPMKMYRMIPCKVPQRLSQNITGSAFVQPSSRYLVMTLDQHYYFKADAEYLQRCVQTGGYQLCPIHSLHHQDKSPSCETDLLLRPSVDAMRNCDVKILRRHLTQWTILSESQTWLYSTAEAVTITVVCNRPIKIRDFTTVVSNTGILHLDSDCEVHTPTDVLRSASIAQTRMPDIHVIPMTLNLSALAPNLTRELQLPNLLKEIKLDPLPNNTNAINSMHVSQHTLDMVTNHKYVEYNSDSLHFGITGIIGITTVIIVAVLILYICRNQCACITCCLRICSKSKKQPVRRRVIPPQPKISAPVVIYDPMTLENKINILRSTPEVQSVESSKNEVILVEEVPQQKKKFRFPSDHY